jgi:hypothetical protein
MAEVTKDFEFKQCVSIIKSTGKKAKNLRELREVISIVSDESIFHHTYQYFLKGHILEYTNDFAHWAGESLRNLAEFLIAARDIVRYLNDLGISDIYSSPYLGAKKGSLHGYDIVDHNALNPEIGTKEEFEEFMSKLREYGMGQALDIVPNHMGIGSENTWWMDLLENGPSSVFAGFFEEIAVKKHEDQSVLYLSDVFANFPAALLEVVKVS